MQVRWRVHPKSGKNWIFYRENRIFSIPLADSFCYTVHMEAVKPFPVPAKIFIKE